MRTRAAVLTVVLVAEALVGAQQRPREAPRTGEPYTAATTAILVDVVVRDKRGRPVTDLTKEDFEIYENDVPQTVGSFSVVSRASGIGIQVRRRAPGTTTVASSVDPAESAAPPEADEKPPTTAMVFDSLTPEALSLAQTAALAELPMNGKSPGRLGVFSTEPGLAAAAALYRGPRARAVGRPPSVCRGHLARRGRGSSGARRSTTASSSSTRCRAASASTGRRPSALATTTRSTAQAIVEAQMANMEMRMIRNFETIDRDHRGIRHRQRADDHHPVAHLVAGPQDDRLLLRGPPGVAGAPGQARLGRQRGQPRQRQRVRHRRGGPAAPEHAERDPPGDRHGRRRAAAPERHSRDSDRRAADARRRADRRPAAPRSAGRPGAPGGGHRRLPRARHQRPGVGVQADRRGQPLPLHADLLAEERALRRQVQDASASRCAATARRCSRARGTSPCGRRWRRC